MKKQKYIPVLYTSKEAYYYRCRNEDCQLEFSTSSPAREVCPFCWTPHPKRVGAIDANGHYTPSEA